MNTITLLACVLLLLLSAFFVLSEFALVRVRPTQLEALQERDPRAETALQVQARLGYHLSAILVSITVCALAFGAIGEELFAGPLKALLQYLPWPWLVHPASSALALLLMTTLHVVLTEMVPRSFAIRNAGRWALLTARPLQLWSKLIHPLTLALSAISRGFERLMGLSPTEEQPEDLLPSEDEFKRMLVQSQERGNLELSRAELIENLFAFSRRTIKEIAVPRGQVVCFDLKRSPAENLALARSSPHTRMPVVEGDLDHVVGVVHMREMLWALSDQGEPLDFRALARPALLVPEMRLIQDLLLDFQKQKQHLALVVNEHGGIDGLVTLEDVLEELVGEIQDEFDREVIDLRRTRGGAWLAQGTVTLEQLEDHLKLRLETEADSVSLGGYLQEQLGRILVAGDELCVEGWRIRVLEMRGMAPRKFLLRRESAKSGEALEPGD
ncbi:MAG TPA: hemolysin family protein [Holophaga sp.]|nr:hemolysin family protein [Holophaga sp.]HPS67888.1 hemolysin family protein [Holophaga sp.]